MTEETIAREIVVFLPWVLMVWIFFENKIPLIRRLLMIVTTLALFSSFTVFFSLSEIRHDRDLISLEKTISNYEERYGPLESKNQ